MAMEFNTLKMEINIKGIILMVSFMGKDFIYGIQELSMKVNLKMESDKESVNGYLQLEINIKDVTEEI